MKLIKSALLILTIISLICPLSASATPTSAKNQHMLTELGISGLVHNVPKEPYLQQSFTLDMSKLTLNHIGEYLSVKVDGLEGVLAHPGRPSLPCKSLVFKLPKNVEVDQIGLTNASYRLVYIYGKVRPAPRKLPFIPNYERFLNLTEHIYEDPRVYESEGFYPGSLINYHVGKSLDATYIFVQIYPIQYSPARQMLLVITQAKIIVSYNFANVASDAEVKPSAAAGIDNAQYIIVTSSKLEDAAATLADFYSGRGIKTAVVTTDWIYLNYAPAENITYYSGFYTFTPDANSPDPYYELLTQNYNWTLALKIIDFLRDVAAHPYLTHVLLFGPSDKVPPSFYYLSYSNYYYVDKWNGWIPTDIFYMSPDYDLIPNYAVGRIPVDNADQAAYIINKIAGWYTSISNPEWFRKAFLSGGYPFDFIFMHGESFVSKLLTEGYVRKLNAAPRYRTDRTYNRSSVIECLSGGYGWAFMIAHGSGSSMIDLLYDEVDDAMTYETLATTSDLAALPSNNTVPIIMSVACMNGAWDEEILPPDFWFSPPSFGEASLLSPAGGIAYIGASRVAWAMPLYDVSRGVLSVEDPLACQYLASIFKAYNESAGPATTLGGIVSGGLLNYLSTAIFYDLTTIMEFQLLGDPYLTIPVFEKPYTSERIKSVEITNSMLEIPVEAIAPMLYYWGNVNGTLPYVPSSQLAVRFSVKASHTTAVKVDVTRILGWRLYYHEELAGHIAGPSAEIEVINETAIGGINLSFLTSGHLLLRVRSGQDELRLYLLSYGIMTSQQAAPSGSQIRLTGWGLDVLGPPTTEAMIEFGGNFIGYVVLEKFGFKARPLIIPWADPGDYNITVYTHVPEEYYWYGIKPPTLPRPTALQKVTLSESLETLTAKLNSLNATIAGLITTSKGELLVKIDTAIGAITTKLDSLNANLIAINGTAVTIQTDIGLIKADLLELKPKIVAIQGDIVTIKTDAGIIKANVTLIKPMITQIKDGIATVKTDIGEIKGKVVSIDGNIATLITDAGIIKADASHIKSSLQEMPIISIAIYLAVILSLIAAITSTYTAIATKEKKD